MESACSFLKTVFQNTSQTIEPDFQELIDNYDNANQEWPAEAVQDGQAGCKVLVSFVVGEFEVTYDILQMTPFAFAVLQYCSIAVEGVEKAEPTSDEESEEESPRTFSESLCGAESGIEVGQATEELQSISRADKVSYTVQLRNGFATPEGSIIVGGSKLLCLGWTGDATQEAWSGEATQQEWSGEAAQQAEAGCKMLAFASSAWSGEATQQEWSGEAAQQAEAWSGEATQQEWSGEVAQSAEVWSGEATQQEWSGVAQQAEAWSGEATQQDAVQPMEPDQPEKGRWRKAAAAQAEEERRAATEATEATDAQEPTATSAAEVAAWQAQAATSAADEAAWQGQTSATAVDEAAWQADAEDAEDAPDFLAERDDSTEALTRVWVKKDQGGPATVDGVVGTLLYSSGAWCSISADATRTGFRNRLQEVVWNNLKRRRCAGDPAWEMAQWQVSACRREGVIEPFQGINAMYYYDQWQAGRSVAVAIRRRFDSDHERNSQWTAGAEEAGLAPL
ncbi:unnamed protein product [Effrenium voratum]|nr:unnamed protein product [Effrenium voratum]